MWWFLFQDDIYSLAEAGAIIHKEAIMKKIISIVLSVVMVMLMASTVFFFFYLNSYTLDEIVAKYIQAE